MRIAMLGKQARGAKQGSFSVRYLSSPPDIMLLEN